MSTKETACEEELTEIKTDQGEVITKSERFLSLSLKQSKKGNRKCVRLYLYRLFEDLRSLWSITDIIVLYILNIKALRCCCNVRRISGPTLTTADYIVPQSGNIVRVWTPEEQIQFSALFGGYIGVCESYFKIVIWEETRVRSGGQCRFLYAIWPQLNQLIVRTASHWLCVLECGEKAKDRFAFWFPLEYIFVDGEVERMQFVRAISSTFQRVWWRCFQLNLGKLSLSELRAG